MRPAINVMQKLKEALQKRRTQLRAALSHEIPADQSVNSEDAAAQINEQMEIDSELIAVESCRLVEIDDALARIEAGTYGVCEECDKPIAKARLEALPTASRCLLCQAKVEAAGSSYVRDTPTDDEE